MNKSFSIKNILNNRTIAGLSDIVKETVISVLTETSSQLNGYMEKQSARSSGRRSGQSKMTHEQWKTEAICRCLQNRQ